MKGGLAYLAMMTIACFYSSAPCLSRPIAGAKPLILDCTIKGGNYDGRHILITIKNTLFRQAEIVFDGQADPNGSGNNSTVLTDQKRCYEPQIGAPGVWSGLTDKGQLPVGTFSAPHTCSSVPRNQFEVTALLDPDIVRRNWYRVEYVEISPNTIKFGYKTVIEPMPEAMTNCRYFGATAPGDKELSCESLNEKASEAQKGKVFGNILGPSLFYSIDRVTQSMMRTFNGSKLVGSCAKPDKTKTL